jgi:hypothetical protein
MGDFALETASTATVKAAEDEISLGTRDAVGMRSLGRGNDKAQQCRQDEANSPHVIFPGAERRISATLPQSSPFLLEE